MKATKISIDNAKKDKLFYFVANVIIYRSSDKKCLILKRSETEKVHPSKYCVPGGKLEWKDLDISNPTRMNGDVFDFENKVEDLLIREAKEEVNADIEIIGISKHPLEYEISKESLFNNYFKTRGGRGKIVIAKLISSPENIKIQEEEISGYKWIKKEEIEKYLTLQNQIESARKIFEEFKDYF